MSVYRRKAEIDLKIAKSLLLLRVVGHLALPDIGEGNGRQVSDKPQGRKLRGGYARFFGVPGLWGFDVAALGVSVGVLRFIGPQRLAMSVVDWFLTAATHLMWKFATVFSSLAWLGSKGWHRRRVAC